jgi:CubicO group peptidase (beta-lactamase class C family)
MREPHTPLDGIAPMGQLWSTAGDLARWGIVLVRGLDGVLAQATADEMWSPQVILNPDDWTVGWGLGIELVNCIGSNQGSRIYGGHTGAMPGFLASLHLNRDSKTGAAVLTNSGTRAPIRDIAVELAEATLELWPPDIEPWHPESAPPPEIVEILGRWWSEGTEFVFSWRDGKLQATIPGAPPRIRPTVFEPIGDGVYRAVSGREQGERLRVEAGSRLVWSGYVFTRSQEGTPGG